MRPTRTPAPDETQPAEVSAQQWKWTVLAGMASYLDAGSIVALGTGLAVWQAKFGMSTGVVGVLAAIGPNAIGAAIGAFIGGRLGDRLGRKRIYQYDLLVYAVGILVVAAAANVAMLFIGAVIIGVAVGADVPTSLALVGEFSPARARGRLMGLTQVAWSIGPIVVLLLAWALTPLGLLGIRIVFVQLFVVAIVTWVLRQRLAESARWRAAAGDAAVAAREKVRDLFRGKHLQAMVWTTTIYLFWNLAAGTGGIFTPYMIRTLGAGSQATSVLLSCAGFVLSLLAVVVVFMRLSDRSYRARRAMWAVGALMNVLSYGLYLFFPFTIPAIIANVTLFAFGGALAGEAFYKVFSQELFPTLLRGTAQGITFGSARVVLGIWSFFVPTLAHSSIHTIALLLTVFLAISGIAGMLFMPDTSGKSLERIAAERG